MTAALDDALNAHMAVLFGVLAQSRDPDAAQRFSYGIALLIKSYGIAVAAIGKAMS